MEFNKLHDLVDCEIDKISSKADLNDTALNNLYKLIDIKKDLYEVEDKVYGMDSGSYGRRGMGYSRRNNYDMMPRYDYSMDGEEDSSYRHLEEAMKRAKSDQEREAIRKLMNQNYR